MNIDSKNDPFVCGNQSSKSYLAGSMLIYWWWIYGKFIVITPFSMGIAFRKGFWHFFQGEWLVIYGKLMIDGWELEHHNGTSTIFHDTTMKPMVVSWDLTICFFVDETYREFNLSVWAGEHSIFMRLKLTYNWLRTGKGTRLWEVEIPNVDLPWFMYHYIIPIDIG